MASEVGGGGPGGKPVASGGVGSSRNPMGGSVEDLGPEDLETKSAAGFTPRKGRGDVSTKAQLESMLERTRQLWMRAQNGYLNCSEKLQNLSLTDEETQQIEAERQKHEQSEEKHSKAMQKLKDELQQLASRHIFDDPSAARSTPSKTERAKSAILTTALETACKRAGWTVCIGQQEIANLPRDAVEALLDKGQQWAVEDAWRMLNTNVDLLTASDFDVDFQLGLLASKSEEAVQEVLESQTKDMCSIEGSHKQCKGPFFKYPNKSSKGTVCYTLTGRPDAASLLLPLFLEIKSNSKGASSFGLVSLDYEALMQGFERVETAMANGGYLSRCVALVATGRCKWIISALRNDPAHPREVTMSLLRLRMKDEKAEERIWMSLTKAAQDDPTFHLTQDGPRLVRALHAAGIPPAFCRVKFLQRGMSNVYECTVPVTRRMQKETVVLETDSKEQRFCVKVVHKTKEFETEAGVLHHIASYKDTELVPRFYFLGSWRADADTVSWRGQDPPSCTQGMADLSAIAAANWWQLQGKSTPTQPASSEPTETKATDAIAAGGVIIMRWGQRVDPSVLRDAQQPRRVWDELRSWLHLYHAAGVLHTDLRLSNVIDFGDDGFQPIDFGMSVLLAPKSKGRMVAAGESKWEATASVTLGPGGRSKGAGQRIRALVEAAVEGQGDDFSVSVQWSQADDWDMLLEMALHVLGYA